MNVTTLIIISASILLVTEIFNKEFNFRTKWRILVYCFIIIGNGLNTYIKIQDKETKEDKLISKTRDKSYLRILINGEEKNVSESIYKLNLREFLNIKGSILGANLAGVLNSKMHIKFFSIEKTPFKCSEVKKVLNIMKTIPSDMGLLFDGKNNFTRIN
jgi:hypothetical protein